MIIGNPYCFAVILDVVNSWNVDKTFQNGILFFTIDSEIFPKEIQSATLSCEIPKLIESLKSVPVDKKIFNMPKEKAYSEIYRRVFPENWNTDNDFRYMISTPSLSDNDYLVFVVGNSEKIRILATKPDYCKEKSMHILEGAEITQAFIDTSEMNYMINKLKEVI